jgi:hypothetical protein
MSERAFAAFSVSAAIVWGIFFYPPAKPVTANPAVAAEHANTHEATRQARGNLDGPQR